jgi:Chaperone of endosialidase
MKTADLPLRNAIQCLFALVPLLLATFWLSARVQAVTPTPDGAYAGANTAEGGSGALFRLTTGTNNTALGSQALFSVTSGSQNTATGAQALKANTANGNTADGFQALVKNTIGTNNTAAGWRALFENTIGIGNTATGDSALYSNTTGSSNTVTGAQALFFHTTGDGNTAVGAGALFLNFYGDSNTATGIGAMGLVQTGSSNTAAGANALGGYDVLGSLGGDNNTAVGASALIGRGDLENNTAVGAETLPLGGSGGSNNIAIGYRAGYNLLMGDYNILIGNAGDVATDTFNGHTIRIGDVQTRAFIAGIYGTPTGSSTTLPVIVDSNGQLGTAASSERFKKEIKPMNNASESILALKPVTFHYKSDTKDTPQFGLIAEDVAAVNPDLVVRDKNGEIYTVRYEAVNAMLLNEFLKEHSTVEKLESMVAELTRRLEEQDSRMQKMSDQLGTSKPAPHRVANR